jgi:hypothetical protein
MIVLRGPTTKGPADLERKLICLRLLLIRTELVESNFRAVYRITAWAAIFTKYDGECDG